MQHTKERSSSESSTIEAWREWVARHRLLGALVAAVVATHMATIVGYFLPGIGLPKLDWNSVNGFVYAPGASPMGQFVTGGFFHYVDGFVFTILFAIAVHPLLPWRNTALGNMAKALVFGTILAIVSLAFMTPHVYAPAMGAQAGFFSHEFGGEFVLAVFVWHWVYALHLGAVFNPASDHHRG